VTHSTAPISQQPTQPTSSPTNGLSYYTGGGVHCYYTALVAVMSQCDASYNVQLLVRPAVVGVIYDNKWLT